MNLWICPRSKVPIGIKNRKSENYALWCLSNSIFMFFNPSKSILRKSRLNSLGNTESMDQGNFSLKQKNNSIITQKLYNYNGNLSSSPEITNALKTGKRNLMNLLHSFCNNHRTLLLKHSAKAKSSVFPFMPKPSKSNLAFPYLPLIKPQTLSFKTKVMPIV